jgi:pyrrolidone-carboxylate peptidase
LLKTQQGPHLALGFAGCPFLDFKRVGNATVRTSRVHETKRPRSGKRESGRIARSRHRLRKLPGARDNPTALLVHALGGHRARLARLGVELETDVLPVNYAEVARKLEELDETLKPDAILHFGLAPRRKFLSIETRALNRLSLVHCDASGARAGRLAIIPGAPHVAKSTFPYRQIEAAFRREGLRGRLSANAGDYVCNETLYLARTLARASFMCRGSCAPIGRRKHREARAQASAT